MFASGKFYLIGLWRYESLLLRAFHDANTSCQSLDGSPNIQQATLGVFAPLMIPETQCFNALLRQKFIALSVGFQSLRQAMLKSVQLHCQLCAGQ